MLLSNTELHLEVRKRHFQQWTCMYMGLKPILKQADENEEGIQLPNVSVQYKCLRLCLHQELVKSKRSTLAVLTTPCPHHPHLTFFHFGLFVVWSKGVNLVCLRGQHSPVQFTLLQPWFTGFGTGSAMGATAQKKEPVGDYFRNALLMQTSER